MAIKHLIIKEILRNEIAYIPYPNVMKILIADDEPQIAEIIDFLIQDAFNEEIETVVVNSGNEAIEALKKDQFDLCISDHNMPNGKGSEILKHISNNNLSTLFVICSTIEPGEMPEIYPVDKIYFNIIKPDITEGVGFLADFIKEKNPTKSSISDIDDQYIPVTLEFLLLLGRTPSDIYIKITETKFLKCLNENEIFTMDDNAKYLSKSVSKLYVKKSKNKDIIVKLIASAITKIMANKAMPINEKMTIVHAQLCDLIKFTNMSEDLAQITKENITQSISVIMKNDSLNEFWKEMNLVGEYPSKMYSLHSMLASVIIKKLAWSSEATMFKLSLAAFLQDITLKTLPVMKIYDHDNFLEIKDSLSKDEIANFLDHPLKAKDLIAFYKAIPPDIDKIILEQHEMPDGRGFPRQLNANQIGPLSCVFILSGLLARFILNEDKNFQLKNFIEKYEAAGYNKGNFKESFKAVKSMLS